MGSYLAAIWQCRYFWLSLVKMDLRTRYRRSVLGIGWSLLQPIAMTAILCAVFHHILHVDLHDYAPQLIAGLACWNYILAVALQGCQCFYQGESYIRQYPAPMAIYPLRTALGATFHFLIALALAVAVAGFARGFPHPIMLLCLLPTVGLMFLLGWSLAVLGGFATVFFQDTQHLLEVGFQILFYASPIIWTEERLVNSRFSWVLDVNPVVAFLRLVRDPIMKGEMPSPATCALAGATLLVTFSAATLTLARLQRRLIFRL